MTWERRLREMVLAGGALTATACGGSTAAQPDAASATSNLGGDAKASEDDGTAGDDVGEPFCCVNQAPDPCSDSCSGNGGPDAAVCVSCRQAWAACEATNGYYETQPDGSLGCTAFGPPVDAAVAPTDAAPADAGRRDAGPTDASDDVQFHFPCCNANPDPCCPIAYCSGGVGPDAAFYVTCEQNRTDAGTGFGEAGDAGDDAHD
jgi:hypothetical protein